ncbi:unnamed protein product [Schistosoma margrebowiei]|uniref:Uncharacterized protein n=1 Tax=Schistosoma margrebowiei TaxID=48269 RepID=A0A183LKN4_9TREM|nr:unnamed protein product [Schistosoma margrebowiei]
MSRQIYCMGRKPGELRKQSSRRYRCLLTVVYAKYFRSVGQTLHYRQQPTVQENKPDPSGGINQKEALEVYRTHVEESTQLRHKQALTWNRHGQKKKEDQRTHYTEKWK